MKNKNNYDYLLADLTKLNGVGKKTMEILKKKKINNIFDLLWRLPKSYTDRTLVSKICDLQIGKLQTIKVVPFPWPGSVSQKNSAEVIFKSLGASCK